MAAPDAVLFLWGDRSMELHDFVHVNKIDDWPTAFRHAAEHASIPHLGVKSQDCRRMGENTTPWQFWEAVSAAISQKRRAVPPRPVL